MGLSTTVNRVAYAGTGSLTVFSFPYKFFANGDLTVILRASDGTETVQTITTHYSVTGAGVESGGTVTMVTPPASGETLVIIRDLDFTQDTDLELTGSLPATSIEKRFDYITMMLQEVSERLDRAALFPRTFAGSGYVLPEPVASNYLTWNSAGNALVNTSLASDFDAVSPTTTKGDLIVRNATQDIALPVGADGEILVADSAQASGVKWETNAGGLVSHGAADNIGLTLSAGTLTITQGNGNALGSGASAGYISIHNQNLGTVTRVPVEANVSFQDASHATDSDIIGEEFGATTGVAWALSRPFYIYAVYDGTNLHFAISPNPVAKKAPVIANCGYKDNPAATPSDDNFFFLTDTDVSSTHAGQPCVRIGGIRMTMDSSDDWTVQALDPDKGDGIRVDPFVGAIFVFPQGQMGANANSYLVGSNSPTWATTANQIFTYYVNLDGTVEYYMSTVSAGSCTNGSSGSSVLVALPFDAYLYSSLDYTFTSNGIYQASANANINGTCFLEHRTSGNWLRTFTSASLLRNEFSNAGDDIRVSGKYRAWFNAV